GMDVVAQAPALGGERLAGEIGGPEMRRMQNAECRMQNDDEGCPVCILHSPASGPEDSMSELRVLINRLNPICKRALETAAALCVAQTHYNVEVEHLLLKLLDLPSTDIGPV